jgi:hypothetical protein
MEDFNMRLKKWNIGVALAAALITASLAGCPQSVYEGEI